MKKIYTKDVLEDAVKKSKCYAEVFREIGAKNGGNSYQRIKYLLGIYNIDTSHFIGKMAGCINAGIIKKKYWYEYLVDGYKQRLGSSKIRKALIESGCIYICNECGLKPEWNGKYLCLQVDHINGDWSNNKKENLRFLCPNCHSQTKNFCISKKKKIKKLINVKIVGVKLH